MSSAQIIEEAVCFAMQDEIDRLEKIVQRYVSGRVRDFRLLIHADGLILCGSASTYHAKQLAQHAIMEATRQPILANEIAVCSVNLDPPQPELSLT